MSTAVFADAQKVLSDRKDRWELSYQTSYIESIDVQFEGGANASINDEMGWAVSVGYNYSEHWAFNVDMSWNDASYSGESIADDGTRETTAGSITRNTMNFTSTYNVFAARFTPFISASLGWSFIDTNIINGRPQTGCWYDPWYGYICDTYVPTKTSTEWSYGGAVGLRFDATDKLFFKASVGNTWAEFPGAIETPDYKIYRIDVGVLF